MISSTPMIAPANVRLRRPVGCLTRLRNHGGGAPRTLSGGASRPGSLKPGGVRGRASRREEWARSRVLFLDSCGRSGATRSSERAAGGPTIALDAQPRGGLDQFAHLIAGAVRMNGTRCCGGPTLGVCWPISRHRQAKEGDVLVPNPSVVLRSLVENPEPKIVTMALWDAWLFAELDSEFALERWWKAPIGEREKAFAVYRAALDREAEAARALQVRLAGEVRYAKA